MTEPTDITAATVPPTPPAPSVGDLLARVPALWADWSLAADGDDAARGRVSAALGVMLLGLPQGPRSVVEALEALKTLAEDTEAPLPGSWPLALQLAHERLADLRLQHQRAARDERWVQTLVSPVDLIPSARPVPAPVVPVLPGAAVAPVEPPPAPAAMVAQGRDWWSIPVDGLRGANQMFLLESRELLRGAELSLAALRRDPTDYGEQMVLCRAFQALAVAASSMGLRGIAQQAAEGQAQFDRLLDDGACPDEGALAETDRRLGRLYADLMELVGESPSPAAAAAAASGAESGSESALVTVPVPVPVPVPVLGAGSPAVMAVVPAASPVDASTGVAEPVQVPEPTAAPDHEPAHEPAHEPPDGPAAEPVAEPVAEPAEALANEPAAEPPPWWWALDWSAWPEPEATTGTGPGEVALAEHPLVRDPTETPMLRVPAPLLQGWVNRLAAWQREGGAASAALQALSDEIENAGLMSVESWAVPLHRELRRVARDAGVGLQFDLEAAGVSVAAGVLQPLLPVVEAVFSERIQAGAGPLRLRAQSAADAVTIELIDLGDSPWSTLPQAVTPAVLHTLDRQGGAWQPVAGGWGLRLPVRTSRLPLRGVRVGSLVVVLPALWCLDHDVMSADEVAAGLSEGSMSWAGQAWPLLRLSALLKVENQAPAGTTVLRLGSGPHRLALVVDEVQPPVHGAPLPWPRWLSTWLDRSGLWGAALDAQGQLLLVTDPFALQQRYGAAARVLSRPRRQG